MSGTGIEGAMGYADALHSLDRCAHCGIEEGERHPVTGKKLLCIPIGAAVRGLGLVCWCCEEHQQEWFEDRQVRLP